MPYVYLPEGEGLNEGLAHRLHIIIGEKGGNEMVTWRRKTYKMVASTIRLRLDDWAGQEGIDAARHVLSIISSDLADEFERDNPSFNRDHFMQAVLGEERQNERAIY